MRFDGLASIIAVPSELTEGGRLRLRICDNGNRLLAKGPRDKAGSGTDMRLVDGLARHIEAT